MLTDACNDIFVLLSVYVDGEADAQETATVEAHLAKCPLCRERLQTMRDLGRELSVLADDAPPDDFAGHAATWVEDQERHPLAWCRRHRRLVGGVGTALLMLWTSMEAGVFRTHAGASASTSGVEVMLAVVLSVMLGLGLFALDVGRVWRDRDDGEGGDGGDKGDKGDIGDGFFDRASAASGKPRVASHVSGARAAPAPWQPLLGMWWLGPLCLFPWLLHEARFAHAASAAHRAAGSILLTLWTVGVSLAAADVLVRTAPRHRVIVVATCSLGAVAGAYAGTQVHAWMLALAQWQLAIPTQLTARTVMVAVCMAALAAVVVAGPLAARREVAAERGASAPPVE